MELLLLITIVGGLGAAGMAVTRGRNPLGWFLFGALFPVLGILLALVLPEVLPPHLRCKWCGR